MSSHIIESIGYWGIKTTPIRIRELRGPQPGDVIMIPGGLCYPFNKPGFARVSSRNEKTVTTCLNTPSVYLCENGSVSISGGPFVTMALDSLVHVGYRLCSFWNWGDNSRGADQGVDYQIMRPMWRFFDEEYVDPDEEIGGMQSWPTYCAK